MLKLEDIQANSTVQGIEPGSVVRIVSVERVGDNAITAYYKMPDGTLKERMLFTDDEPVLSLAEGGKPWRFDASGVDFKLATEAYRINLAYLFDPMMAVHTSNVDPFPHQITAVYESMLPRQPLRFVLADDPGAGKTIMAGLFIRELVMRADGKRILIVAPGSLVEQWQEELREKFGLNFAIFNRTLVEEALTGNPFDEHDFMIARLDQLSRNEELVEKLKVSSWDLVVVDEAHKMSAHYYGHEINKSKRYQLGETLGSISRHFLLMTATPHNGKEEDFQLFLALLDSDRFYGKFRDGAHKVDVSDVMRRMVKEELLTFQGTRLFPERRAYTVNYKLSDLEAALYAAVTEYVKLEMNKADQLEGARRGTIGFALTSLQRRLASSPEAIYQSLKRRRQNLSRRLADEKLQRRGQMLSEVMYAPGDIYDDIDEYSGEEYENISDTVTDQATAARTIAELESEIQSLIQLEEQARQVVHSGQDRKWEELSKLLQNNPEMRDSNGRQRKLIIFTEHRDTLNYLTDRIRNVLGKQEAVVEIHGGVRRDERRKVQELFRNDPETRVLVATDAAGEGVNLQNANLMVNYDLPWNPNRLEQRFGRIHRIGQREVCHLWNMVANETREGDVFQTLFDKLEREREALGGRVFDILGEVFEGCSLKDLLLEAIRYGEDPKTRAKLEQAVEGALDTERLREIIKRNALCEEVMDEARLFSIKDEMEKAEARKLQPHFIRSFFKQAFELLDGELKPREQGRFEISYVPSVIRERDRQISGRDRMNRNPVVKSYERICFEKKDIHVSGKPMATLMHPGHPLMQAVVDLVLEAHRNKLKEGTVLVDPSDPGLTPRVMFLIDHAVRDGNDPESKRALSRRIQFVELLPDGTSQNAGWGPHLDYEPISKEDLVHIDDVLNGAWLHQNLEQLALNYASNMLVPEHFAEVKSRRERSVEKTLAAVHERLVKEIHYWEDRYLKLKDDVSAGKQPRVQVENVRRTIDDLTARLQQRTKELVAMRHVVSATPVIVGGALIIPAGLLANRRGENHYSEDPLARKRVEQLAMKAVIEAELALGHDVIDVSAEKCGWDITARPPKMNGKMPLARHIEVKGRQKGQSTITVTRNEILYGLNQAEKFILGIVLVDGHNVEGPYYVARPFSQEPEGTVASVNLDLTQLLAQAVAPAEVPVRMEG